MGHHLMYRAALKTNKTLSLQNTIKPIIFVDIAIGPLL